MCPYNERETTENLKGSPKKKKKSFSSELWRISQQCLNVRVPNINMNSNIKNKNEIIWPRWKPITFLMLNLVCCIIIRHIWPEHDWKWDLQLEFWSFPHTNLSKTREMERTSHKTYLYGTLLQIAQGPNNISWDWHNRPLEDISLGNVNWLYGSVPSPHLPSPLLFTPSGYVLWE